MPKVNATGGSEERKIAHPKKKTIIYEKGGEYGPLTVEVAKELLGWMVVTGEEKRKKDDFLLVDYNGDKIVCLNDVGNRPFDEAHARKIAQDILTLNYRLNGENVIIGRTGVILSAQHRLIGLVLASQMWASEKEKDFWAQYWKEEPYIETSAIFGIDESPEVVRTLDNTRPRGFADVMVTSGMFKGKSKSTQERMCKVAASAIKMLWDRTGRKRSSQMTPFLTNSELTEFMANHQRVAKAVDVIFKADVKQTDEKNSKGKITRYIPPGAASAMLYLMGASGTEDGKVENYLQAEPRMERQLSWGMWDKAVEFWELIADGKNAAIRYLTQAIVDLGGNPVNAGGTMAERMALIALAWDAYKEKGKVVEEDVYLDPDTYYQRDGDDEPVMYTLKGDMLPTFGGIDSPPADKGKDDPEPEEIEEEKKRIEEEKIEKRKERQQAELRKSQGGGGVLDKNGTPLQTKASPKKPPAKVLKGGL